MSRQPHPAFVLTLLGTGILGAGTATALDTRMEVQAYGQTNSIWHTSPLSQAASQPDNIFATEWRPDLAWRPGTLDINLKPRLATSHSGGHDHARRWLNEGWLRWQPAPGWSLQGGREALLWGLSMFWNLSNPLFPIGNKANPQQEVAGKDLLRVRWQTSPAWALTGIGEIDRGETTTGPRHLAALKLDWTGEAAAAALITATEPGHTSSLYGFGQWTASEATLVYGEFAWGPGQAYSIARRSTAPSGWTIATRTSPLRPSALVGASYTSQENWTAYLELWHNGNGLSPGEAAQLGTAAVSLAQSEAAPALAQLGSLVSEPSMLRRNYLGLQVSNDSSANTTVRLRLTHSLDDHGNEWVGTFNHVFSDHLQGWVNLMRRSGARDTEYGRWMRGSSMTGLTWFAW